MKRLLAIVLALLLCAVFAGAQEREEPQEITYEVVDSVIYIPAATVDSTLAGKDVFEVLSSTSGRGGVSVAQSAAVREGMFTHIRGNKSKTVTGYRVRIFFDNKQDSRSESEAAMRRFQARFPGVAAYRSFTTPFFKVTVGDFRTKSEAMQLLQRVQGEFPAAFVVKEKISYPVVDKEHAYIVDTLHITRPIVL